MNVRERVQKLRPIDDAFFEKLIEDKEVCEEILRVILEDPNLSVLSVTPQSSFKNLWGRSVRLDAFCKLGNGKLCNIEVQKADNDDHVRRVRYNASCITSNNTPVGSDFLQVPDVTIVYISAFDIFGKGKTIYHCRTTCDETNDIIDNGLTEIYVNTAVHDGTVIAELMRCFEQTEVDHNIFPLLSKRVSHFKNEEGGINIMCDVIKEYASEVVRIEQRKYLQQLFEGGLGFDQVTSMLKDIPKEIAVEVYEAVTGKKVSL